MKQIIKKSVSKLVSLYYFFYSNKIAMIIKLRYNQIYSFWISNDLKKVGDGFFAESPLYIFGGNNIHIGNNFYAGQRLRMDTFDSYLGDDFFPKIIIGNNVSFQKDCHIGAINEITIGDNVLIASKVYISDHSHGKVDSHDLDTPPSQRKLYSKGAVIIEDNVWLGEGVVVLPGVKIGKNSIIGANAVVTKSIPENSVAIGNPARVLRTLSK